MADGFSVSVKGLKDVDERLALLGAVAGEKIMRTTLFTAVKPIADQAIANIAVLPKGSGALAKATRRVYIKRGTRAAANTVAAGPNRFVVAVAPKAKDRVATALANLFYKKKKPIRGVFWGHLVEWGFQHQGGKRVQGRQVFTRAVAARSAEAIEIFRVQITKAVDRALKRRVSA